MQAGTVAKRIGWIDAMRGFTMILVVFSHVEIFGLGMHPGYTGVNDFFRLFRMPLFFFVSGFIAFRPNEDWDWGYYRGNMLKKMRVQIIPMLFFGLLYVTTYFAHRQGLSTKNAIVGFFDDGEKVGYWFTEALLGMFFVYYTVSFLLRKCKLAIRQSVLVVIALALFAMAYGSTTHFANNRVANWLCLYQICLYFQFFVFGNLVSCYREKVLKVLGNQYVAAAVLLLFGGLYWLYCQQSDVQHDYVVTTASKLMAEVIRFCGVITVVAAFRHFEHFFSVETWVGRGLQHIGQRTLDIYLIHYFLIPALPALGLFFGTTNNLVLETTTVVLLSLLVIFFCLIISNIIRISPFLAYWLLGVKRDKK
ncbi:MAG: acyltransferase family protein [Bacteroidales bacterium]|nr:acyltransferase family protein [Bacteroidales bacterium]